MHFREPQLLWLLWLLVPMLGLLSLTARRRRAALLRFADAELLDRIAPPTGGGRGLIRSALVGLAFLGLVLAAAAPRWGFSWENVERRGVDLVVALDLSRSMLAEDSKPDRLTAAKREIADLLGLLQGDRVALVAFAGSAFVQCPLTLDYHAFELFLSRMDPNWVPVGGTNLAEAVRVSIGAFPTNERAGRAVLLITDGEDHSGELPAAAEEARAQGVHVFVVGIGGPEGAPIPDGRGGFVKEGGKVVLTRLDEPALKELALTTEGTYVRSVAGDLDLRSIYLDDIKGTLQARELSSTRQRRWEERFQFALLPALLLLVMEGFLGLGAARMIRGAPLLVGALGAALVLGAPGDAAAWSLFGPPAPAHRGQDLLTSGDFAGALEAFTEAQVDDPADRRLDYNIGQAQYRLGAFPEAEKAFLASTATDRKELAADAFYGAGNAAVQQGKFPDAIAHYERCLVLRPDDADALHNRDVAQRRFEEQMEQAQQEPEEQPPEEAPQDGEAEEQEPGEEGQEGQEQQQKQQQQPGQSGEQQEEGEDGQTKSDGERPEEPQDASEGQGEQGQKDQQDAQKQTGGAAAAADLDRNGEAEDTPAEGAVSSTVEPGSGGEDAGDQAVVEGALSKEQAEQLLKALAADQKNRRDERTEREAQRGSRAAGKDW